MFGFHERTERGLCRGGFVLFCLLPTLLCCGWIGYASTDRYAHRRAEGWSQMWSDRLGVHVVAETISGPRPDTQLIGNVRLLDRETRQPLGRIRLIEIVRQPKFIQVTFSQPEIEASQLRTLVDLLDARVLPRCEPGDLPLRISAGEITLHASSRTVTLSDVTCLLEATSNAARAAVDFRIAGVEMNERATFRLVRNRAVSPPATTWEFHSGAALLPCGLAAEYFPFLATLGPDCRFRGSVRATSSATGWQGEVHGRFEQLDLDRLITDRFPHKLSGQADVVLRHARFEQSRLVAIQGTLESHGGVVSRSLLAQASRELRCHWPEYASRGDERYVRYRQLACGFSLDPSGLTIHGTCVDQPAGTIMAGGDGPILLASEPVVPAVALVRMLATPNEQRVPATKESAILFGALPLPPIERDDSGDRRSGYIPLRMHR